MASLDPITGILGFPRASHLLRRATFGATREEIDSFAGRTIEEALSVLFEEKTFPEPPADLKTGTYWIVPGNQNSADSDLREYFRCWFYNQMFMSGTNIREKMVFFLHTHFTAISSVVNESTALYYQNQLLRKYAFGDIRFLSLKICTDNAMLILLDNRLNENVRPNENFARELLELYTIGKGKEIAAGNYTNYTEQDVKAAARILSGWNTDLTYTSTDPETGIPSGKLKLNSSGLAFKHDAGVKTFSSAFGNREIKPSALSGSFATADAAKAELTELVNMIFEQRETALHFCRKLYRFFVYYKISEQVETEVISPMADVFINNGYTLKPVLELLFKSKHFFDEDDEVKVNNTKGAIIKSPLEITIGAMRFLGVNLPDPTADLAGFYKETGSVLSDMEFQGFNLYEPLDVAGYEAYFQAPAYNRNWISANFLASRYQFGQQLAEGKTNSDAGSTLKIDALHFVNNILAFPDPSDATGLAKEVIRYLLPENITEQRFQYFLNILLGNLSVINWQNEWNQYKMTGDDMAVRMQLNAFISAVLQSAEYQLC